MSNWWGRIIVSVLMVLLPVLLFVSCSEEDGWGEDPQVEPTTFLRVTDQYTLSSNDIVNEIIALVPGVLDGQKIQILMGLIPSRSITVTKIAYRTQSPSGSVVASGIIACPSSLMNGEAAYSRIVSVQHGTCDMCDAPSLKRFPLELAPVFRPENDVVIMADYIGYGLSQTENRDTPYMHDKYTAVACADLLLAAGEYLGSLPDVRADGDNITLIGYSQGGQATMATLFELEKRGYGPIIDQVWAGAGPYDLQVMNGNFQQMAADKAPYYFTGYIPFMIRGIIYGEKLDVDVHNIYNPYVFECGASDMFSSAELSTWHNLLGNDVGKVLHPDFSLPFGQQNSDLRIFSAAVTKNSLVSHNAPQRADAVTLFHMPDDDQVPYICSVLARDKWKCNLVDLEIGTYVDRFDLGAKIGAGVITGDGQQFSMYHIFGALEFYLRYLGMWDIIKLILHDFPVEF